MNENEQTRFDFPDADLQDRVYRFLTSRHFPAFRNLDVDVCNGVVTVVGEVSSYYEKQVALTACQRVAGVLDLIDKIIVEQKNLETLEV